MDANELGDLLLEVLPPDGSTLGNLSTRQALSKAAEREIGEEEYDQIRDKALLLGTIKKGRGRGGSIALGEGIEGGHCFEGPQEEVITAATTTPFVSFGTTPSS